MQATAFTELAAASIYSRTATVPQLFTAAATAFPDKEALVGADGTLTYAELLAYAHRVTALLRQHGVGQGHNVGIVARRSVSTVGGILGILFSGACYVALDVACNSRSSGAADSVLAEQLATASVRIVLCDKSSNESLPPGLAQVVTLPAVDQAARLPHAEHFDDSHAEAPAYIMFTSGSTGIPKGVIVPQRAIVRLVSAQQYIRFSPDQRYLLHSPLNFDASTFEMWGALLHGGTLVIAPGHTLALEDFRTLVRGHDISTLWLTAALFHLLSEHVPETFRGLEQLVVGGDVVSPGAIQATQQRYPALRIVNGYGPTECTTFAVTYTIPPGYVAAGPVPLGECIAHTSAYILDDDLEPVPDGQTGQLVLGGDGVASGYLHQPSLTGQAFRKDPSASHAGAMMYLTGDRAFRDGTGIIHFRGRLDRELKCNGRRINLDEIEGVLAQHPNVRHAAIFTQGVTPEEKQIVGAIECKELTSTTGINTDSPITELRLRTYLAERLASHCVPNSITILNSMPLNANGKLDRSAILAQLPVRSPRSERGPQGRDMMDAEAGVAGSGDELALVLAAWKVLLGSEGITPDDNFFDAGGDSLTLIQLHFRLNQLGRGRIDLMDLFSATTPRKMAGLFRR